MDRRAAAGQPQLFSVVPWIVAELPAEVSSGMFAQPGAAPLRVVHRLFRGRFEKLDRAAFAHVDRQAG